MGVTVLAWTDVLPSDPAKSCPPTEPTGHRPCLIVTFTLPLPQTPTHTRHDAILRHERRVVRAVVAPPQSATNIRMPSSTLPHARDTASSNPCLLDTHHIQILGPKTHILQDKEAPKVRREESRPTRRHIACVFTAAAIPEPRGSHRLLYAQDVRSRVGHMSAV